MVVLTSLWFPTKMISSRQSHLGPDSIPTILFFGAILLLIGILLIALLKMERNDLFKEDDALDLVAVDGVCEVARDHELAAFEDIAAIDH